MNREQHQGVYDTVRHRTWRRLVLRRQPLCDGWPAGWHGPVVVVAVVADHVKPLRDGGGWSLSNGQGLCLACHGRKAHAERVQTREGR